MPSPHAPPPPGHFLPRSPNHRRPLRANQNNTACPRPNTKRAPNRGTECYCGESLPSTLVELSDDSCAMACAGDGDALCGGRDAIVIYSLGGEVEDDGGAAGDGASTSPR